MIPTAVTMEHISEKVSPSGSISSAPKDFSVYVRSCVSLCSEWVTIQSGWLGIRSWGLIWTVQLTIYTTVRSLIPWTLLCHLQIDRVEPDDFYYLTLLFLIEVRHVQLKTLNMSIRLEWNAVFPCPTTPTPPIFSPRKLPLAKVLAIYLGSSLHICFS